MQIIIEEYPVGGRLASRKDLKARTITIERGVEIDRVVGCAWASVDRDGNVIWSLYDITAGGGCVTVCTSLRQAKRALKRLAKGRNASH
jgi:hypothetical protein